MNLELIKRSIQGVDVVYIKTSDIQKLLNVVEAAQGMAEAKFDLTNEMYNALKDLGVNAPDDIT